MNTLSYVEGLRSRVKDLEEELQARKARSLPAKSPPAESQSLPDAGFPTVALPAEPAVRAGSVDRRLLDDYGDYLVGSGAAIGIPQSHPVEIPSDLTSVGLAPSQSRNRPGFVRAGLDITPNDLRDTARKASESEDNGSEMDAMGVATAPDTILQARWPSGYFGPSSNHSLLGDVCSVAAEPVHGQEGPRWETNKDMYDKAASHAKRRRASSNRGDSTKDASDNFTMTIPPRTEADGLVDGFWRFVHSLYPFIHRPSFEYRYTSLWVPHAQPNDQRPGTPRRNDDYYDDLSNRLFYCMLNLVFALGGLFNPRIPSHDRDKISRSFYDRAKQLLDLDFLSFGSTPLVQTLLLMGQYLQSTEMPSACWTVVGLAIRVAQGIGPPSRTG